MDSIHLRDTLVQNKSTDTVQSAMKGEGVDEEFNLFLFSFFFGTLTLCFGIAIIGVIIISLALLSLLALIIAGIISVAAIRGLYKKSFGAGVRTAAYLGGTIAGATLGAILASVFQAIWKVGTSNLTLWLAGSISGAAGGALSIFVGFWLLKKAWHAVQIRIDRRRW